MVRGVLTVEEANSLLDKYKSKDRRKYLDAAVAKACDEIRYAARHGRKSAVFTFYPQTCGEPQLWYGRHSYICEGEFVRQMQGLGYDTVTNDYGISKYVTVCWGD